MSAPIESIPNGAATLRVAQVVGTEDDRGTLVCFHENCLEPEWCVVLEPFGSPCSRPEAGDTVLVWTDVDSGWPVILGRLSSSARAATAPPPPDELVIEAKQSLTLRVGDGSITIREDGRILIKGRELVSHAKGMNRIRGGSVAIN